MYINGLILQHIEIFIHKRSQQSPKVGSQRNFMPIFSLVRYFCPSVYVDSRPFRDIPMFFCHLSVSDETGVSNTNSIYR